MKDAFRVVEELCDIDACTRRGTHWHPLSIASLAAEKDGEYTLTIRVRSVKRRAPRRPTP